MDESLNQVTSDNTQTPADQDTQLIGMLEGVLSSFRQEMMAEVHSQIGQVKNEFSAAKSTKEEATADESINPSTQALQQELNALKSQLKKERMSKELTNIAAKHEAYPDLLELKLSQEEILEHEGQFYVKSKDGQTKSVQNYVEQLLGSEDGQRFVQQKRPNVAFNSGKEVARKEMDVADVLYNAI